MKSYKPYWKTKDGRRIPLEDLSDEHLKNCIGMLKQNTIPKLDSKLVLAKMMLKNLEREQSKRGGVK